MGKGIVGEKYLWAKGPMGKSIDGPAAGIDSASSVGVVARFPLASRLVKMYVERQREGGPWVAGEASFGQAYYFGR